MPGSIRIYCINSEYKGNRGILTAMEPYRLYNILIDGVNVGATACEWTKEYPVEAGRHEISIILSRRRSSPPLKIEVKDNQPVSLLCGINRKGDLFVEPDVPSTAVMQQDENNLRNDLRTNFRSSINMFFWILRLSGIIFISMEISMYFHATGLLPIVILGFLYLLALIGYCWLVKWITSLHRKQ
jgi:hypothetical protein